MRFVRAIWKLLVGIKDALVLLFMLLFFGLLYAGLSARPEPVGDGVLALDLDGTRGRAAGARPTSAELLAGGSRMQASIACATWSRRSTRRKDDDRVKAVALDLDGFLGGGQTAMADLADALRPGARVGQAGGRLCDRLYRRRLPARRRRLGNLAQPAGRGGDRRAGRLQPLFQGPARQARGDRQRLSRRHLQVGGRAVHPQRHVARGDARMPRRSAGALLETWREDASSARGPRRTSTPTCATCRARSSRPAATWRKAALARQAGRQASASAARSRRGWPSSAARTTTRRGGFQPDQARLLHRRRASTPTRPGRSASSPSPARSSTARRGPGTAGGDSIAEAIERGPARRRRSRRWSCASTAPAARCSRPSGSARRCSPPRPQDPGRGVDGQCRGVGRLLGRDPGRLHLRRAVDDHRLDRRVRRAARASRARWPSSASAPTASRRRRCRASPTCSTAPRPRPTALIQAGVEAIYRHFLAIVAAVAPQDAGRDRPDRPGPRVGRRHRAPARPGRRLRRNGRGDRQGGRSWPSSATSAASAISSGRAASSDESARDARQRGG